LAVLLSAALIAPISALAQAPVKPPANDTDKPTATGKPSTDPCAAGRATIGSGNAIVTPNAQKSDKTLSDHLAQSGGVICPPAAVDPEIKLPTPETGRMPVIPPPGTPGGDQSVKPK
jgi:hypothetical protein